MPWDVCFLFSSVLDSVVGEEELEMLYIPEISETLGLSDAGTLNPVVFAMTLHVRERNASKGSLKTRRVPHGTGY